MNNFSDFFNDATIKEEVVGLWGNVFQVSNKIIKDANFYGFDLIDLIPDPNVHQILKSMKVINSLLEDIMDDIEDSEIQEHIEMTRIILNAKQQILLMEKVAISLKQKDKVEFDSAINAMKNQATI